jgi:hypothetical protein
VRIILASSIRISRLYLSLICCMENNCHQNILLCPAWCAVRWTSPRQQVLQFSAVCFWCCSSLSTTTCRHHSFVPLRTPSMKMGFLSSYLLSNYCCSLSWKRDMHHHVHMHLDWPHRLSATNNNSDCLFGAYLLWNLPQVKRAIISRSRFWGDNGSGLVSNECRSFA